VKYLLDTHTFIWFTENDAKLSNVAQSSITDIRNDCCFSVASIWEIVIKQSLGKPDFTKTPADIHWCTANNILLLNIETAHLQVLQHLPPIHNDPFDRLLIAQAVVYDMTIITRDTNISRYPIKTIW
jgi:PIN domain nuclease of toxin-antitoxin system